MPTTSEELLCLPRHTANIPLPVSRHHKCRDTKSKGTRPNTRRKTSAATTKVTNIRQIVKPRCSRHLKTAVKTPTREFPNHLNSTYLTAAPVRNKIQKVRAPTRFPHRIEKLTDGAFARAIMRNGISYTGTNQQEKFAQDDCVHGEDETKRNASGSSRRWK